MRRRRVAAGLAIGLLVGCAGGDPAAPPEILYGQDICDACRMVISEPRHAAAVRLGDRNYRFDDPGCLVAFVASTGGFSTIHPWVHDESAVWRRAREAWYVRDPGFGTPMASGILSFSSEKTAVEAAERLEARPLRWAEIQAETAASGDGPDPDKNRARRAVAESRR